MLATSQSDALVRLIEEAKERETLNAGAVASDVPTTPTTEAVVVDGVSLRVLE